MMKKLSWKRTSMSMTSSHTGSRRLVRSCSGRHDSPGGGVAAARRKALRILPPATNGVPSKIPHRTHCGQATRWVDEPRQPCIRLLELQSEERPQLIGDRSGDRAYG